MTGHTQGLTLLQTMLLLAILGIVLAVLLALFRPDGAAEDDAATQAAGQVVSASGSRPAARSWLVVSNSGSPMTLE